MKTIDRAVRMTRLALKYRDPAWVTAGTHGWVHRYRGGILVTPTLRGTPLRLAQAKCQDLFCYDYTPSEGDTIVELGAEFGTETLALARMVGPTGRVIAVEAHPGTCKVLREVVRRNNLTNVVVVHAAIGSKCGTTTISDGDAVANTVGAGDIEVPALTLADLLRQCNVSEVAMLKVNIEGAEGPLLAAMTPEDAQPIRHAVISCHDFRADRGHGELYRTGAVVDENLARLGFTVKRRPDEAEDWARGYRYARRAASWAPMGGGESQLGRNGHQAFGVRPPRPTPKGP